MPNLQYAQRGRFERIPLDGEGPLGQSGRVHMLKAREMDKYLVAHRILKEEKAGGRLIFVDARDGQAPAGWLKIDDPVATVHGPRIQRINHR